MTNPEQTAAGPDAGRKPLDEELDVFGLTHQGKVRTMNQDNFLVAALREQLEVKLSSLPSSVVQVPAGGTSERLAFVAMVADGVGGGEHGEMASRMAVECAAEYLNETVRCFYATGRDDAALPAALQEAALQCHARIVQVAEREDYRGMATTLTLFLGVWPWIYLLQVGDSRCYRLRQGELHQVTRDQTMAQELVDLGVLPPERALGSRLSHVLSSAIGGQTTTPKISRFPAEWENVYLLCSDGLTRHVTDARIGEVLRTMTSSRQACETLLNEALADGGTDNITVVIGRTVRLAT